MNSIYFYNSEYSILLKTTFEKFNEAIVFEDFLNLTSFDKTKFKFDFKKGILYYKEKHFEVMREDFWELLPYDIADYEIESGDLGYEDFRDFVAHTDYGFTYLNEEEFDAGDDSDKYEDIACAVNTETNKDILKMALDRDILYYIEYL